VIRLAANTVFSFLNLDDRTVQVQLTSGSLNISVRRQLGIFGFPARTLPGRGQCRWSEGPMD
jgi:hypothetical protein